VALQASELTREWLTVYRTALDQMLQGEPVASVLHELSSGIAQFLPEAIVSILSVDENNCVHHLADHNLPQEYINSINGLPIGPSAGACGTAAWRKEVVICSDIESDPLWVDYRHMALPHGLRACWSVPLIDNDNIVLGTFAIYHNHPKAPSSSEQSIVDYASSLVLLVLRHGRLEGHRLLLKEGLERSPVPFLIMAASRRIIAANQAAINLFGYEHQSLVGQTIENLSSSRTGHETLNEIAHIVGSGEYWRGEMYARHRDGEDIPVEISVTSIPGIDHKPQSYFIQLLDLRDQHADRQELERLAFYDTVTALPNRTLLNDRLSMALADTRRAGEYGALVFIDLDHFKRINDVYGHSHGDQVLRACAEKLSGALRETDTLCRLGGDEFIAVLRFSATDPVIASRHALKVAKKMEDALTLPLQAEGHTHRLSASMGVSIFPKVLESVDDLLREADTAMYRAKASGRQTIVLFDPSMHDEVSNHYNLEQDLRIALEMNQLRLYLQPQVNPTGQWIAAEALLRWEHPVRGLVPPLQFIPIAEESGLIIAVGEWVLTQACQLLAQCEQAGKPLKIAVNVSARQINDSHFVAMVERILRNTGADPLHLTMEVTESVLLGNADTTADKMHQLARLGVHFSIDDFGTGYSNLGYLRHLPLRELKIDKSFVQDVCQSPDDAALVEVMLTIARHLGLRVVAEGVESLPQSEFLIKHQCDYMQGYLFGKPEPAQELVAAWLGRQ